MSFSEREGYTEPRQNLLQGIDNELKNNIWTVLYEELCRSFIQPNVSTNPYLSNYNPDSMMKQRAKSLWTKFFKRNITDMPDLVGSRFIKEIRSLYDSLEWYKVYDLIEFLIPLVEDSPPLARRILNKTTFVEEINNVLEENNSLYHIVNNIVQPISDKNAITLIEEAHASAPNQDVEAHLEKAEKSYSRKQDPDFGNACLESVKAVESALYHYLDNTKSISKNIKKLTHNKNFSQHILAALEKIAVFRGDQTAHAKKPEGYEHIREDAILVHRICCGYITYFASLSNKMKA